MKTILETQKLTKQYGAQKAAADINLSIHQGEIYGLIGQNGAGKTTILRMLANLAEPTSGNILIYGKPRKDKALLNTRVGSLIEEPGIYPDLSAKDNLYLKALAMGVHKKGYEEELLELVGLKDVGKKKTKGFSLGMRQRLGIALALIGNPDIVLLDEPINGLDPQGIVEIRELILYLNKEKNITFLISSHLLEELSRVATRYGFIAKGKLISELSKEELLQKSLEKLVLQVSDSKRAITVLGDLAISDFKVVDDNTLYIFSGYQDMDKISMEMAKAGVAVRKLAIESEDLESFYLSMVGGVQ